MKLLKKILLWLAALITIAIIILFIIFWPIDPRLSGEFISDKEATIQYLASTRKLTDLQNHIFNQIYGHLTYSFDGHKIKIDMEPHKIIGFAGRTDRNVEGWEAESYYFIRRSNDEFATLVVLPSPIWKINDTQIVNIEFEQDGFWVKADSFILNSVKPPFKEKFKKTN